MIPEHAPQEIVSFCEERGIQHIHIDTDEYDVDCIPNKEEKKRVVSVRSRISLSSSFLLTAKNILYIFSATRIVKLQACMLCSFDMLKGITRRIYLMNSNGLCYSCAMI